MPSKEQVDRVADKLYTDAKARGENVSRDQVRDQVVEHAKRIDNNKK
jgi:hypothetical protein